MVQYGYDFQNRVISKQDPGNIYYTYDAAGRLTQVNDYNSDTGTYTFSYDNMNRLTSTTTNYQFTSIGAQTVQYGYDAASNRTSMTDPVGTVTSYSYDQLNRLTALSNSWAGAFGFSYDVLGNRTQLTRPNGVNTYYSYDALSHLLSVEHGTTPVLALDGETYSYDAAGNRLTKQDLQANLISNYTYDNIYQLLQVTQSAPPPPHSTSLPPPCGVRSCPTTESYTYDLVGDRLSSLSVANYTYNSSNELLSNSSGSYTYDHNGNTLTDATGRSYTWDLENRISQIVMPGSGGRTTFKYDPFGRRIQKSGPLGTTNYLYDVIDGDANLIEEMDSAGNLLARYNHELEADTPLSMFRSGTASYYERDGLGSVTSLSDSAGALVNTYTYDSFGKLTASTGTLTNPFQYTAREFDPETGLYEYRARYYDQSVGRFNSEDPIRFKGGIDFYRYVGNNPITRTDPDGMGAAACAKALANLAKAYAVVDARLAAFIAHGDMDPGHAKALGQAVNRLNNAIDDVKKNCDCDLLKAEAAAAVAAATALATQVGDT
ncbi:MAG: RHS repeat-associated core domain-containing protein, partial [Candidatus Sulfotelmatobacter sp.]